MATGTAQLLIGNGDIYHDGIIPTHRMYLTENDRPALILAHEEIFMFRRPEIMEKNIWIPTIENMLDDMLLMIAVFVVRDTKLINQLSRYNCNYKLHQLTIYDNLTEDEREFVYEFCKSVIRFPKIVLTVLNESTIKGQLDKVKSYKHLDIDVCVTNRKPKNLEEL